MKKRCLVTSRLTDLPEPRCPADIDRCGWCAMAVWRSRSSPKVDKIMCTQCASDILGPDDEIMPPTAKQMRAVRKATQQ